jgi:hypothetical protein
MEIQYGEIDSTLMRKMLNNLSRRLEMAVKSTTRIRSATNLWTRDL